MKPATLFKITSALLLLAMAILPAAAQMVNTTSYASGTSSTQLENTGVLNMTTMGTTDWVQFGVSGTSTAFGLTNEKSGGSVGGLDTVGAVSGSMTFSGTAESVGQTQNTSNMHVSYANGEDPLLSSSTVSGSPAGIWSVQTAYGRGAFTDSVLTFTIDFDQAISSGNIYVATNYYTDSGLQPSADFITQLNSETPATTTVSSGGVNNLYDIFDVSVADMAKGDTLTISWELPSGGGNDNVSFSGVALDLTAAPEPSTDALLGLGVASLVLLTRFRRPAS